MKKSTRDSIMEMNRRYCPPGRLTNWPYAMESDERSADIGIGPFVERCTLNADGSINKCLAQVMAEGQSETGCGVRWYHNKYTAAQVMGFKDGELPTTGFCTFEELIPAVAAALYDACFPTVTEKKGGAK